MKIVYFECNMGAAGDMLCASLLDTMNNSDEIIYRLNNMGFDGVHFSLKKTKKCSVAGSKFDVLVDDKGGTHTSINDIYSTIDGFNVSQRVKDNAKAVYTLIAEAESVVHGEPVAQVHLHEVGAKDAIADVTAFALIMEHIGADLVAVSPVATGSGTVNTAHGIMNVPAPATTQLLKGMPSYGGDVIGELCTPTGAAILKYYSCQSGERPPAAYESVGYGMGTKDFDRANCVRAFIGETEDETVFELRCNVDDMTGEEMGYALEKFMKSGAKDAYVQSITMKKSRPGMLLTVIASPDTVDKMTSLIFKHTTTLGVRKIQCRRSVMDREYIPFSDFTIKRSQGFGTEKEKFEFDDLARIADENDISVFEARKILEQS